MAKDYCTGFFERFPRWQLSWKPWRVIDISEICKAHDDEDDERGGCDSTKFAKGLIKNRVVGGLLIFSIASIACWVRYPLNMIKRV